MRPFCRPSYGALRLIDVRTGHDIDEITFPEEAELRKFSADSKLIICAVGPFLHIYSIEAGSDNDPEIGDEIPGEPMIGHAHGTTVEVEMKAGGEE